MEDTTKAQQPVLRAVDAVMVSVPDLDAGIAFYSGRLGHRVCWRSDELGQAGLECPDSTTELVLSTTLPAEPNWLVRDAAEAARIIQRGGGRLLEPLIDIPVGRVAIVEDPFGNRLVLVDLSKGTYRTDADGMVTDVTPEG
jgi:predicted enzyme related to lactoylglutathione lyase